MPLLCEANLSVDPHFKVDFLFFSCGLSVGGGGDPYPPAVGGDELRCGGFQWGREGGVERECKALKEGSRGPWFC